ncbi:MAG: HAD family hydrolase, partial [Actinomycetota bacterium]
MTDFDALIVDFGGVLTTPLDQSMIAFAEAEGIELEHLVRAALGAYAGERDDLVTRFETGKLSESEFASAFAARLSEFSGKDISAEGLVQRIFGGLRLEEDMLEAVAAVKGAGIKTGLLSNSWGVDYYPIDKLKPLFDALVISGEVGMRKPDPEIFHLTTEKLGVAAERCVFVDDHPGHLKAAQEVGMTTVLHRGPEQTIAELSKLFALTGRMRA